LVRKLRSELKVNTTCGASNVSFGLPQRSGINNAFLPMLIAAGMTSAIVNPLHPELVQAIRAGDVLTGVDDGCTKWISAYKEPLKEGENPREGRRRRRA
jgi:5-methyltetrahydrofolate--homocysteine methyltransferase